MLAWGLKILQVEHQDTMATFSLVPYSIRFRKAGDSDQYLKLGGDYNDAKVDVMSFLNEFIADELASLSDYAQTLSSGQHSGDDTETKSDNQVLVVDKLETEGNLTHGIFRVGEYGYSAPLLDIQTGDVAHTKSRLEAELHPYYFLINIKPESEVGIVLLQAFNNQGIKDAFFNKLYASFRARYNEFIIEMSSFIPQGLVKEYLSNRIIEIRLVKFGYPSDILDVPADDLPKEEPFEGTSELVIKPPIRKEFPKKFLDKLHNRLDEFLGDADSSMSNFLEVKNFQYNTAKIKVKHGNSDRTVDLINTGRLKYSEELDGKVSIDAATGFPSFQSIDQLAKEFLDDIKSTVWGENT